jgi:hypothetical protein
VDHHLRHLRVAEQPVAPVTRWALAGLLGCVVLAVAYLPPRGAKSSGRRLFVTQPLRDTPARQHAQALAKAWRGAAGSLHLLTARPHLHELVRAASRDGNSLVVVAESGDVATTPPAIADSAAHVAWHGLGLGETKINVALVIQLWNRSAEHDRPPPDDGLATYLAPDSTDRTTCIAVIPAGQYWTRFYTGDLRGRYRMPFEALVQSLKAGLGPCAFYAAYGTPSRSVRGWLVERGWDVALTLDPGPRIRQSNSFIGMASPGRSWYWDAIYSLPPEAVACLAHRPDGCRAALLWGASDDPVIPFPDFMRIDRRWWVRVPRLAEGHRFLADVAREVGRERFRSFWTSALPVDTALAAVLKRPVGEWTADWQGDLAQPIRLGPAAPLGASGIALVIAALALTIVAGMASRRQVR